MFCIVCESWKSYSQVFGLADVACRKDHAVILTNTCMPLLMEGINTIEESDVVFSYASDADDAELIINLAPSNRHTSSFSLKPTSFLAGDLAFLAVIMGKENFSSSWCNWCKLSKVEWQNACPLSDDMLWDINEIKLQADCNVENGFRDAGMKGVWSSPMSSIPFSRIIFSGLHAAIGIGNRIIHHLEEFIDIDVEDISFQLLASKSSSELTIKTLRDLK